MRAKIFLSGLSIAVALGGCASKKTASIPRAKHCATEESCPVLFVDWMDGDFQTGYEPARELAETEAKRIETAPPNVEETDKFLSYVSTLDASGRYSQAESELKKFIAKNPNENRAVFLLGVHYMRLKRRELATHFFRKLEKDSNFKSKSLVYNNLGMLALQSNEREAAIEYFEKAAAAQPPTPAPHVNLGALYLQSKSFFDAEKAFRKALGIDSDFEDAALGLGVALEGQGKFQEAHEVYRDFLSDHSASLSITFNDAAVLGNRLNQKENAAQMMLRYIQRGGRESAKAHEMMKNWR